MNSFTGIFHGFYLVLETTFKPPCSSHSQLNFEEPPMFSTPVGNPDADSINAYSQCNHASSLWQ